MTGFTLVRTRVSLFWGNLKDKVKKIPIMGEYIKYGISLVVIAYMLRVVLFSFDNLKFVRHEFFNNRYIVFLDTAREKLGTGRTRTHADPAPWLIELPL